MADRKISDLTALTAPASGDYLPIVDISEAAAANKNKRITIEELFRGVPLGTAAAPSIAIEGDENTGIYSPGADQLAISTGGSGRLFVDASGRVSIGSSNPGGQPLAVSGGAILVRNDTDLVRFNDAADSTYWFRISRNSSNIELSNRQAGALAFLTSDVERLRITSTGTVNIVGAGTAGSTQAVSFNGSAPVNSLVVDSSGRCGIGTSSPSVRLQVQDSIAGGSDGTVATLHNFSDTGADTRYVGLNFRIGSDNGTSAIRAYRTNSASNYETNLSFWTNPAGATQTPLRAMTIDSSQRVGIGVTSPGAPLEVNGTVICGRTDGSAYIINRGGYSSSTVYSFWGNDTTGISNPAAGQLGFLASGLERARIDGSGRLLVGTPTARTNFFNSSPSATSAALQIEGTTYPTASLALVGVGSTSYDSGTLVLAHGRGGSVGSNTVVQNNDILGYITFQGNDATDFVEGAAIKCEVDGTPGANDMPGRLVFSTTADGASSPTPRMGIYSNGTTGIFTTSAGSLFLDNSAAAGTTYELLLGRYGATALGSGTASFRVWTNGNVVNTNNSYGAISDIKLKENIVDAGSQWDDLKALQVRKYNFKEGQTHTQIGLVAQEVELVSPGLVTESPDRDAEGNDLGTVTKSVNYSVLYMKAVKALQEAMERIEQLEADVAALKAQ